MADEAAETEEAVAEVTAETVAEERAEKRWLRLRSSPRRWQRLRRWSKVWTIFGISDPQIPHSTV